MLNIKLKIAYDGTHYLGWQKTIVGKSIEECLQSVLEKILQEKIVLQAASRTDAGVHARGQVANFFSKKTELTIEKLHHSLNSLLPKDIVILSIKLMPHNFHPTLDCSGKTYHYQVCNSQVQLPCHRLYSWHVPHPLDLDEMRKAAALLIGRHDFSAFCNSKKNEEYKDYIREVQEIQLIESHDQRLSFILKGNHFLYKMVRNLVGTLVYVGRKKIEVKELPEILQNKDRTLAGVTAPAQGLTLFKVNYLR